MRDEINYSERVADLIKYLKLSSSDGKDPRVMYEDLCEITLREEGLTEICAPDFP